MEETCRQIMEPVIINYEKAKSNYLDNLLSYIY
jgi:hypothetical protein